MKRNEMTDVYELCRPSLLNTLQGHQNSLSCFHLEQPFNVSSVSWGGEGSSCQIYLTTNLQRGMIHIDKDFNRKVKGISYFPIL